MSLASDSLLPPAASQPSAILLPMNLATEPAEPSLAELLHAIASNKDRQAFAAFYDATSGRILSLVLRITQRMEIAEEVVGDVYLQIWRKAEQFDPERGSVFAWLTVLSRSRALDSLRKNKAAPTVVGEAAELESPDYPQDLLAAVDRHSALHAALEQLKPDQRQLLALAYFRGYSHGELAGFTGIPLGTVKTQLRRAVLQLKEIMVAPDDQERESA